MLARWLPAAINTRPTEWSRAAIGMALGTLLSVWLCAQFFGMEVAQHLIGPLGASAVLLFAVSSGALAQPWSIIGGYLTAGVVALLAAHVLGRTLSSACLAAGMAVLAGARWPLQRLWRTLSMVIDTALLGAGATLWWLLQLHPLHQPWLGTKLGLLVVYIGLGTFALKRGRTRLHKLAFGLLALAVLAFMVSVALERHPLGWWRQ